MNLTFASSVSLLWRGGGAGGQGSLTGSASVTRVWSADWRGSRTSHDRCRPPRPTLQASGMGTGLSSYLGRTTGREALCRHPLGEACVLASTLISSHHPRTSPSLANWTSRYGASPWNCVTDCRRASSHEHNGGARGRWMRQLPRCALSSTAAPVPLGPVGICPSEHLESRERRTDGTARSKGR